MQEQLVLYETAKLAKEKGFDWKVSLHYESNGNRFIDKVECNFNNVELICSAPTQSLLQKWLREVHNIHIEVLPRYQPKKLNTEEVLYSWAISCKPFDKYDGHNDVLNHWIGIHNGAPYIEDIFYHVVKTYEEALEIGLYQALLLL